MELILWRHAEAEDGLDDMARRLTAKGRKQAEEMAGWLRKRLPEDTKVVASPAVRTQETAQALDMKYVTVARIAPGADVTDVLQAVGWPDGKGAVLVVGHQPTLGRVAAFLLAGEEAEWSIKKGGVWWISSRVRQEQAQTVLRAVMGPDLL